MGTCVAPLSIDPCRSYQRDGEIAQKPSKYTDQHTIDIHLKGPWKEDASHIISLNDKATSSNHILGIIGPSKGATSIGNNSVGNAIPGTCMESSKKGDKASLPSLSVYVHGRVPDPSIVMVAGMYAISSGKAFLFKTTTKVPEEAKLNSTTMALSATEKTHKNATQFTTSKKGTKRVPSTFSSDNQTHGQTCKKSTDVSGGCPKETTTGGVVTNLEAEEPPYKTKPFPITGHGTMERGLSTSHVFRDKPAFLLLGKTSDTTEVCTHKENFEVEIGETQAWGENATIGHHKNLEVIQEAPIKDGRPCIGDPGITDDEGNTPTCG